MNRGFDVFFLFFLTAKNRFKAGICLKKVSAGKERGGNHG